MNLQDFKKIINRLDNKIKLTQNNLIEVSMSLPTLQHEYIDIWGKEARETEKLRADIKKLYGILYEKIKHKSDVAWETKAEIETQIYSNDEYHKKSVELYQKEKMVEQLLKCIDNIKNTQWTIRNIIDWNKQFGQQ